jgi:hypothetical protein
MSPRGVHELRAPENDGEILLWPDPSEWRGIVEENRKRIAGYDFTVLGKPFRAERAGARGWVDPFGRNYLYRIADRYVREPASTATKSDPWILSGHQPPPFHPGVWIKNFIIRRLADAVGGEAYSVVTGSDVPDGSDLTVPVRRDGAIFEEHIPFAEYRPDVSLAGQPKLNRDRIKDCARRICSSLGDPEQCGLMGRFWRTVMDVCDRMSPAEALTTARMVVEQDLGLRNWEIAPSTPDDWRFSIFEDAERLRTCYNVAVDDFRRRRNIRSRGRPVPFLDRIGNRVEVPYWGAYYGEPRRRVFVEGRDIFFGDERLVGGRPFGIAPRALALTMFLRLFVADLFIHGLGGGKYDEVTDDIIRRFYGVEPPRYVVATATLHLPLPTMPGTAADLLAVRRELRELAFSPDRRALRAGVALTAAERALCEERARLAVEADKLRAYPDQPGVPARRAEVHRRLGELADELRRAHPEWETQLKEREATILRELAHNKIARSREWFFALYPPEKLKQLLSKLPDFR